MGYSFNFQPNNVPPEHPWLGMVGVTYLLQIPMKVVQGKEMW